MKSLTYLKSIALFITFSFLISSCGDESILDYEIGTPGTPVPTVPGTKYYDYLGAIPPSEEDWEGIPVLTDVSQLGWENNVSRKINSNSHRLPVPVVTSQGPYGTCVSSAVAYALSIVTQKASGMDYINKVVYPEDLLYPETARRFSVAFIHYMSNFDRGIHLDSIFIIGQTVPGVIKNIKKRGAPTEADWPYSKVTSGHPDPVSLDKALFNGYKYSYFRFENDNGIAGVDKMKEVLREGSPIVFCLATPVIRNQRYLKDGKEILGLDDLMNDFNSPNFTKKFSYHAMTIIGYDNSKSAFLVLNSHGEGFGGSYGAPKGCFWLKYDLFEDRYRKYGYNVPKVFDYIVYGLATVGIDKSETKQAVGSLLYEFTGFRDYIGVKYDPTVQPILQFIGGKDKMSPAMEFKKHGYIRYPRRTVIPTEGTIEFDIYIKEGYYEKYKYNGQKIEEGPLDKDVLIFSTLIDRQTSKDEFTGQIPTGGMQLRASKDGSMKFRLAINTFDNFLETGKINVITVNIPGKVFDFNNFNKIGLSYTKSGTFLRVNGKTYSLGMGSMMGGNAHFHVGYTSTINDAWTYINQWGVRERGTSHYTKEGFIGYLKAFHTSRYPEDWIISK